MSIATKYSRWLTSSPAAWCLLPLLSLSLLTGGCSGRISRDDVQPPLPRVGAPSSDPKFDTIGKAPLRRLTNTELLNTLADLFPTVAGDLPALPKDAIIAGFDNAAEAQRPSDVRIARFEAIARRYAEALTVDTAAVKNLVGCDDWSTEAQVFACATAFVGSLGRKLFRRPLADDERARFVQDFVAWSKRQDFESAATSMVATLLQTPQFLYRIETGAPLTAGQVAPVDPFAMASRLSFLLWQSAPDDTLLEAAAQGRLASAESVRAQAERMLNDPRAGRAHWGFVRQWLALDRVLEDEHIMRTPEVDPVWGKATQISALRESQLFVENVLRAGGTLTDLLTSRRAWPDAEIARIYGVSAAAEGSEGVLLPENQRAGLLTRVAFLAAFSHRGATSPPIRGNNMRLRVLCLPAIPPPIGRDTTPPTRNAVDGPKTNRTLFHERTRAAMCFGCHESLNGLGFAFESYSASGAYQSMDNGLPVDSSGALVGTDVDGPVAGAVDLSRRLSESPQVHECAARLWTRYALGRAPSSGESAWLSSLQTDFKANGGSVRELLLSIATSPTFRLRRGPEVTP